MKQNVPTGAAIMVIAIMAVIIGMIYWKFASPGAKAEEIEKAIQASVIKSPPGWKPGQPIQMGGPAGLMPGKMPSSAPAHKK